MSNYWIVSVSDRAYGPYTTEQMEGFAAEGRLAASSLIARAGETSFRSAGEEPQFSALFQPSKMNPMARDDVQQSHEPATVQKFGRSEESKSGERSRFVIISDMKSRSIQGVEEEIHRMGSAYSLLPQVWLLMSELSVNAIRNLLTPQLGKLDSLIVVDATHDKAAWFNFGPEADTRIRKLWSKEAPVKRQIA
ncbi:MAG TPA: GYF domain-containing protein [Rhizomicrobium sp.]|nr:GYF domain-containing protein [Rhizomicrobium sp.]